jgi:cytoskeletal protein RodZ
MTHEISSAEFESRLKSLQPSEASSSLSEMAFEAGVRTGRAQQRRSDLGWAAAAVLLAMAGLGIANQYRQPQAIEPHSLIAEKASQPSEIIAKVDASQTTETTTDEVALSDFFLRRIFPVNRAKESEYGRDFDPLVLEDQRWQESVPTINENPNFEEPATLRSRSIKELLDEIL